MSMCRKAMADSKEVMELRTDAAVLFLAQQKPSRASWQTSTAPGSAARSRRPIAAERRTALGFIRARRGCRRTRVAGVYLQGNVILSRGDRRIRATELYYDFENDRALILDAVMWADDPRSRHSHLRPGQAGPPAFHHRLRRQERHHQHQRVSTRRTCTSGPARSG